MAWSTSAVFREFVFGMMGNSVAFDLDADTFRCALYNNSITPDKDATAANSAYNAGQWATAQEQYQAVQWPQAGVALSSITLTKPSSGVVMFDAADTASGASATLSNVYGCEVYDDTLTTPVADQGVSFHYFGSAGSVGGGTLTVVWSTNGIIRGTV
jgi:hypothetical protein